MPATREPPVRGREETISGVVGLPHVPQPIRSLSALDRIDYVDLFTATTPAATERSAEQWARALLEEAPAARRFAFIPWRILLQLRLGPRHSPDHVHGWRIADRGANWIRIETASWCMTCHAVGKVDDGQVSVALFVRYDRLVAAAIWPVVSIGHRRAMPVLLRQALRAQRDRRRGQDGE